MRVIIGATPEGKRELLGFQVGTRESTQSWRELLVDIKGRGLAVPPEVAVGDGAMGRGHDCHRSEGMPERQAPDQVWPSTRHQRCWVHKTANVVNAFPKSMAPAVKSDLQDISHAETRAAAQATPNLFREKYTANYPKTATCLTKDRDALMAFHGFPAGHREHLRSSNPIRKRFRHGPPPNRTHQRRPVPEDHQADGLHPDPRPPQNPRGGSTPEISCRRLSEASSSPTVSPSATLKTAPPDQDAPPKIWHSSGPCRRSFRVGQAERRRDRHRPSLRFPR